MRKISIIFIIVLFCVVIYLLNTVPKGHTIETTGASWDASRLPFRKGEKLTYEVRHKKLKIGESILTFHGEEDAGDERVYHITFFTSVPTFKDIEELYAYKDSFLPMEVHRRIRKTIGFDDRIVEKYDQERFRVDISQKSRLRSKGFSIEKDSKIHNAILLTYYYRTKRDFKIGDRFTITLPTLDFDVMFNGIETVETPLGEYRAYSFTSDPPKFKLWISTDERRIPLKIENPGTLEYSLVIKSIE